MFLGSSRRVREPNLVDRIALAVTAPVQRAVVATIDGTVNAWRQYVSLRSVRRENAVLQEENTKLRADVVGLAETRAENDRLRRLVHYDEANPGPKVIARVLGINPDPNRLTLRIDRGEGDGVRRGQAVVTADGVVGQVLRSTASAADVLVVFDPNCRLGGRIQRTRSRVGIAGAGDDQALKLEYLLRTEDLEEGDLVVTSGTDGVYPPGLVVGRVTGVQRQTSGMFLNAGILPAVNFGKVEEVVVLAPQPSAAFPARIDVTVAIVAFLSLRAGLLEGAAASYAVGYLLDLMTGRPTGLYTLLAVVTFLLGRVAASVVDVRSGKSFALFAMAADATHGLLAWGIGSVSSKQVSLSGLSGLPLEVLLTGLGALLLYPLLKRFGLGAEKRDPGLLAP